MINFDQNESCDQKIISTDQILQIFFFYSREFNQDLNAPDDLVIFDTGISEHDINGDTLVRDVLLASSDAPVYFLTPKKLGSKSYIDGGIGGYQFFGNY